MTPLFTKLNLKDQTELLILNWGELGAAGFEPVRQVAIDEDWSAVRFRRVAYIKKITRRETLALTDEGKARARK